MENHDLLLLLLNEKMFQRTDEELTMYSSPSPPFPSLPVFFVYIIYTCTHPCLPTPIAEFESVLMSFDATGSRPISLPSLMGKWIWREKRWNNQRAMNEYNDNSKNELLYYLSLDSIRVFRLAANGDYFDPFSCRGYRVIPRQEGGLSRYFFQMVRIRVRCRMRRIAKGDEHGQQQ